MIEEIEKVVEVENAGENKPEEKGSAIVIALFALAMMSVFVAIALTRTSSEAAATGNEASETRAFYAAQGSLEMMTRNFNKMFDGGRQNITPSDINGVITAGVPVLDARYIFNNQRVDAVPSTNPNGNVVVMTGGPFSGLYALRDTWRLQTTATDRVDGSQVALTRNILRNKIPIFQFGVFYEDDLELFNGPTFAFGGRVHSNRHFFLSPSSSGAVFDSRVTAAGHIAAQIKRNGDTVNSTSAYIRIKNASGVFKQLMPTEGSVVNGTPNVFGPGMPWADNQLPSSRINSNFATDTAKFDGNLQALVPPLRLPMKLADTTSDLVESIRRGKDAATSIKPGDMVASGYQSAPVVATAATADLETMRTERYANKPGIRVSLSDSKEKLPGCVTDLGAAVAGDCGVRLDGATNGGDVNGTGYDPMSNAMTDGYVASAVNAYRIKNSSGNVWIKIETVQRNIDGSITSVDITKDFLSLGVTEQIPAAFGANVEYGPAAAIKSYDTTHPNNDATGASNPINSTLADKNPSLANDSRSVIKIQRFNVPGDIVAKYDPSNLWISTVSGQNVVPLFTSPLVTDLRNNCPAVCVQVANNLDATTREVAHWKRVRDAVTGNWFAIVPFPIEMLDMREGLYYDPSGTSSARNTYYTDTYFDRLNKYPVNGAMSMIDIDVANLRRFFRGDFNGKFPSGTPFATGSGHTLTNADIPQDGGWVLYISDRRGDRDFDGELDMEDIYGGAPGNDNVKQPNEELDPIGTPGNSIFERSYLSDSVWGETERYKDNAIYRDKAAVVDHPYYRRGVRLINGTVLPGIYDATTSINTRGFTLASENGVYVQGNYNAVDTGSTPSSGITPYNVYRPFDTPTHIPASIVADSVTILSNNWTDSKSFNYPWALGSRVATRTYVRFAMISGDTITSLISTPNQGTGDQNNNGGLHNFKRFLENWAGVRLNYAGSLINLFNSHNNNGSFKCCNMTYSAPNRDWVFDSTFLDPTRLPPGTPFFQYIQTTGFERTNE